jgi:hypothetical protein
MAGAKSDQKLAAIITPAANPNIAFNTLMLISLKKKTRDAPRAVTNQVNNPANKASRTGGYANKNSI